MLFRLLINYTANLYLRWEEESDHQEYMRAREILPLKDFRFPRFLIDIWVGFPDVGVLGMLEFPCPATAHLDCPSHGDHYDSRKVTSLTEDNAALKRRPLEICCSQAQFLVYIAVVTWMSSCLCLHPLSTPRAQLLSEHPAGFLKPPCSAPSTLAPMHPLRQSSGGDAPSS